MEKKVYGTTYCVHVKKYKNDLYLLGIEMVFL